MKTRPVGHAATTAELIPETVGSGRLVQRVLRVEPNGEASVASVPTSDTVGYVVGGEGRMSAPGGPEGPLAVRPGNAFFLAGHEWVLT
ncbi:MAG TPA: hypothetical protein VKA30_04215, partial [Actinomycetota bacterium]|nr:hypothetical protein [Actinomycetota bacterium]